MSSSELVGETLAAAVAMSWAAGEAAMQGSRGATWRDLESPAEAALKAV